MDWIQPLELKTWMVSVFSGTPEYFLAIALFVISVMSGYFRMNSITMFFMMGLFMVMFSSFISSPLIVLMIILGGLVIGIVMANIFGH